MCWVFGTREKANTKSFALLKTNDDLRADYGSISKQMVVGGSGLFNIDFNKNDITINEVNAVHTESEFTAVSPIALFSMNENGNVNKAMVNAKLFSCKIYENDSLIRDFRPCKMASDIIGLWDEVENKFYGNKGTGTFIAGPEISEITS